MEFIKPMTPIPSASMIDQSSNMARENIQSTHQTKLSASEPVARVQSPGSEVDSFRLNTHDRTAPVVLSGAVPLR